MSLTEGDTISIESDIPSNPIFKIDIVEVKPVSPFKSVTVVNCDVKLDFEAPLDYVEPAPIMRDDKKKRKQSSSVVIDKEGVKKFNAFKGNYQRLDGKELKFDPVRHPRDLF